MQAWVRRALGDSIDGLSAAEHDNKKRLNMCFGVLNHRKADASKESDQ
jgi:hypothetical protein